MSVDAEPPLVTHAFMNEFRIHTERVLTVLPRT